MRLYHAILILSALIVSINVTTRELWFEQFSHVVESIEDFGGNWLPAVRQASSLARLAEEYRRLELRALLTDDPGELGRLVRRMNRQGAAMEGGEARLDDLARTPPEQAVLTLYRTARQRFMQEHHSILNAMAEGRTEAARAIAIKDSVAYFSSMMAALESIERLNEELGERAVAEAAVRYRNVRDAMFAAAVTGVLVALGAAFLAARRISKPISDLAECMAAQGEGQAPACPLGQPRLAVREVSLLYKAFRDLSDRLARSMKHLEDMAVTDQLTGIPNRRKLMEEGPRMLDVCRRAGKPCSALMIDIDFFKKVNDTHGHAVGDQVLRHVAAEIARHVRGSDLLGRYGGEEFALVAPNSGREEALQLAERLRRSVEMHPVRVAGRPVPVTISIGAASVPKAPHSLETLLERADAALYAAKQGGRNRVEASPPA